MRNTTNLGDLIYTIPDPGLREDGTNKETIERLIKAMPIAMSYLTVKQLTYIKHRYYEQMNLREIAELYNVYPSTVHRVINNGLRRLRNALQIALL